MCQDEAAMYVSSSEGSFVYLTLLGSLKRSHQMYFVRLL